MRTGFKSTLLGIELGTLEVKGEWSDHYTTEATNKSVDNLQRMCVEKLSSSHLSAFPYWLVDNKPLERYHLRSSMMHERFQQTYLLNASKQVRPNEPNSTTVQQPNSTTTHQSKNPQDNSRTTKQPNNATAQFHNSTITHSSETVQQRSNPIAQQHLC